jgi:hypothetical protein
VFNDLGKRVMDAIELSFEISFLDDRQVLGLALESIWLRKSLLIPNKSPHLMEGVVGIPQAVRRLLDVGELRYVLFVS